MAKQAGGGSIDYSQKGRRTLIALMKAPLIAGATKALVHTGTYFGILVEYCVDGTGIITGTLNSFPVKRGRGRPDKNQTSPGLSVTPGSVLVDVPVVGNVPAVVLPSMGWKSSATEGTGVNQLRVVGVVHERMRPIQQVILKNGG